MLTRSSFHHRIKNTLSSILPTSWYATLPLVNDVERGQDVLNDKVAVFKIQQVQGWLSKVANSSALHFTYGYFGTSKTIEIADESLLDDTLSKLTEISQWVISSENSKMLYKYRDKRNQIKTAHTQNVLDREVAQVIPSSYIAWEINDVTQVPVNKTYVMKEYNWFWSVINTKRYIESDSKEFLKDCLLSQQSSDKSKLLTATGLTAIFTTSAYLSLCRNQNPLEFNSSNSLTTATNFDLIQTHSFSSRSVDTQFLVNTYTTSSQEDPSVASLANGGFVVVWTSHDQVVSDPGDIYGQRYDNSGVALGSEFQVNTYTTSYQYLHSITGLANGDFVVVWLSDGADGSGTGISGQRYDSIGTTLGSEFVVNTYTTSSQGYPFVTGLVGGGFVVAWEGNGVGDSSGIYAKCFNSVGATSVDEFRVNTYTTGSQGKASIAGLANGGFAIVWQGPIGSYYNVYGQRYNSVGAMLGSEFQINSYTTGTQYKPFTAGLTNGDFVVTWTSSAQDGDGFGIFAQRFDASGLVKGSEFKVNSYTLADQQQSAIAALPDGGFIITWDSDGQDGNWWGVFAALFDAQSVHISTEFNANTVTSGVQDSSSVALLDDGNSVVVWADHSAQDGSGSGVFGRVLVTPPAAQPAMGEFRVNTYTSFDQLFPAVAGLRDGGFVAVWQSGPTGGAHAIYGQRYSDAGAVVGLEINVISHTTNSYIQPSIADVANGGFIVVWSIQNASYYGIGGQRYDSGSNPIGSSFVVTSSASKSKWSPSLVELTSGDFVVTWESHEIDKEIFARRFNSAGTAIGTEFQVNSYTTNDQNIPSIARLTNGGFVVTWDGDGGEPSNEIYGQIYDSVAVKVGGQFRVNSYIAGTQWASFATGLIDNGFLVSWRNQGQISVDSVYVQRFDNAGSKLGNEFSTDNYIDSYGWEINSPIAVLANNNFVVTWTTNNLDGDSLGIFARYYDSTGIFTGEKFQINTYTIGVQTSSTITGLANGNFVVAWQSNDQVSGGLYDIFAQIIQLPELAGSTNNLTYVEKTTPLIPEPLATISSVSTQLQGGSVAITSNFTPFQDLLSFVNQNNITGSYSELTGVLTLSGIDSIANYQTALRNVTYSTNSNPGNLSREVTFKAYNTIVESNSLQLQIDVTPVNDIPVLNNNNLDVNEGQSVILGSVNISATDADNDDAMLSFTVSAVSQGQFELLTNPGVTITTFAQQQIIDSQVQFVHDGGVIAPSYDVSVSDGLLNTAPATALIQFDVPVLLQNNLAVNEGETKLITALNLNATDIDSNDADLIFIVSNIQHGQFEFVSSPGVAIASFTQQQINNSEVQFVHDGGEIIPSYEISLSDGTTISTAMNAVITFTNNVNDAPVLINNSLMINEGQIKAVTASDLSAIDDNLSSLLIAFNVINAQYGQFETVANPGIAITSFTQQTITNGLLRFAHDGSEQTTSYSISVSDGVLTSAPVIASVTFNNVNDAPAIANNELTIDVGQTKVVTSTALSATDSDSALNPLAFTVNSVQYGQFELVSNPAVGISTFTQQQISSSQIQFVHSGQKIAPTYQVAVSDGFLSSAFVQAKVNFPNIYVPNVISSISTQITSAGRPFHFEVVLADLFADGDGDPLLFTSEIEQSSSGAEWLQQTNNVAVINFDGNPTLKDVGRKHIVITANDGKGGITTTSFNVIVRPNNQFIILLSGATVALGAVALPLRLGYRNRKLVKKQFVLDKAKLDKILINELRMIDTNELIQGDKLAEGHFATVYSGTWNATEVAIKQWKLPQLSKKILNNYIREVETVSALKHPNITTVYGGSTGSDNNLSLVMELMEKGTLAQLLISTAVLDAVTLARIASEIAAGLSYLHGQRIPIVHRQLNSKHVLLDDELHAKLTDFAFEEMKALISEEQHALDQELSLLAWQAPELFDEGARYTPATDIYSFGMLLWALVTRRAPFEDASNPKLLARWVKERRGEEIPDNCPEILARLMRGCWETHPQNRPTIEAVTQQLKLYMQTVLVEQNAVGENSSQLEITPSINPHELKNNYDSVLLSTTSATAQPLIQSAAQSPHGMFNAHQGAKLIASPRFANNDLFATSRSRFPACWDTSVKLSQNLQEVILEFTPSVAVTEELLEDFAEQLKASNDESSQKDFVIENCDVTNNTVILTTASATETMILISVLHEKSGLNITSLVNTPIDLALQGLNR